MSRNIDASGGLANLDRNTRYYHGDFVANYSAPDGGYFHHGPNRPGVIQQNWAGEHTWNTWQQRHATEEHISTRDRSTMNTLATRLWAIDIRARTPIPTSQYVLDPTALMQGNYRATNPQGR